MATRVYLPSSGAPAVTPATWLFTNQINPLTLPGVLVKGSTAMTTRAQATGTTSPTTRAMLRYVVGPLADQTISGTVKAQIRAQESSTGANATLAIAVKIVQPNGVDRATLLGVTASDSATSPYEFLTALTNRRVYTSGEAQPINLSGADAQPGDYLVIEIGFRSATTTSRTISLRIGDAAVADLPDDTTSTLDDAPYVEFSGDILLSNVLTRQRGSDGDETRGYVTFEIEYEANALYLTALRCINQSTEAAWGCVTHIATGRTYSMRYPAGQTTVLPIPTLSTQRLSVTIDARGRLDGVDSAFMWPYP